jgi:hypothetical protein
VRVRSYIYEPNDDDPIGGMTTSEHGIIYV